MIRRWPDATLTLLILTIYAPVAHKPDAVARLPGMSYTLLSHFAKSSLRCTRLSARSTRLVRYLASLGHSLWYSGTVLGCGRRSLLPMTLRCVSLYSVPTPCLLHWPWPCRVFRTSPGHLNGRLHEDLRSQISGHSPSPTYEVLLPLLRTTSSLSHSTFYPPIYPLKTAPLSVPTLHLLGRLPALFISPRAVSGTYLALSQSPHQCVVLCQYTRPYCFRWHPSTLQHPRRVIL